MEFSLDLSPGNSLSCDHIVPSDEGMTFVCINPLTGGKAMWLEAIAEPLRAAGHGLLVYNLRGQAHSTYTGVDISSDSITADLQALMAHVRPSRPVYTGLSVGGLFAARAHLAGGASSAIGLVFINTLRRAGARLNWVNDALVTAARTGGLDLLRDLYAPLLFNEDWLAENRGGFLKAAPYQPPGDDDPSLALLEAGRQADWDIAYEDINVPVLNVTGLEDKMFLNRNDVDILLARIKNVQRVEMADCGHMVPVERPAELARHLLAFADTLAAPS